MSAFYKKNLLFFLVYLALFAAIIFFFTNPAMQNINKNKAEITAERKQLAANYDEISSLQKIEKDKDGFEKIKNTVQGYLPESLNSSQFIVEVEGLAKKIGITINSFSMSQTATSVDDGTKVEKAANTDESGSKQTKKKRKSGTEQNEFSISTKADFAQALDFIQQMEKLSRFNSVSSLNIVSTDQSGIDVKITGYIYYEQQ